MHTLSAALAFALLASSAYAAEVVVTKVDVVTAHVTVTAAAGEAIPYVGEGGVMRESEASSESPTSKSPAPKVTTSPSAPAAKAAVAVAASPKTTSSSSSSSSPSTTPSSTASPAAAGEGLGGGGFLQTTQPSTTAAVKDTSLVVNPPNTTPAPASSGSYQADDGKGLTISLINSYGSALALSYGQNAGANVASPVGIGPSNTIKAINNAETTSVVMPSSWAGRIAIGEGANALGSKIEGAYTGGWRDIDISYVDGYTVPIVCSANGKPFRGCNLELFDMSTCADENSTDGRICINTSNTPAGTLAPPQFFAPCEGSAYVYPKNDASNVGDVGSNTVTCCIGSSCAAPTTQTTKQRRGLPANEAEQKVATRAQKREHIHRHAHAHAHAHKI